MSIQSPLDLHLHTTVSDGSDTPEELLAKVRTSDIRLFSVTDHDAVRGCQMIQRCLQPGDPAFLCGAEFSCKDEQGKYHILAYGYETHSPGIQSLVERSHSLRMEKVLARLDFLRNHFGFTFPEPELQRLLSLDNPGKPHIGNLMVRCGYAATKEEAIENYINQLHMDSAYLLPETAISGILAAGGIPVLAHPCFGSGSQRIAGVEMENRLRRLMEMGLQGVEAYYSGFSNEMIQEMLTLAEQYALYVTAGSDYHGSNKTVKLGATGMNGSNPIPPGMRRFIAAVGMESIG